MGQQVWSSLSYTTARFIFELSPNAPGSTGKYYWETITTQAAKQVQYLHQRLAVHTKSHIPVNATSKKMHNY